MRITLSGDLGSGKSSVGRRLSELLGIPYISAGALFREIGHISNMDALTTNLAAETNTDIDEQVDRRTQELNRTLPDFVIDSRMAWHFVTDAVRVFLSVRPETAAERVLADTTRRGEKYEDTQSALKMLRHRRDSELKRYRTLYNVDIEDPANYDLWIISDDAAVDDICDVIRFFAHGRTTHKNWIPKARLVPLIDPPGGLPRAGAQDAEPVPLPLHIAQNFGLYSDRPEQLAAALKSRLGLVPFRSDNAEARRYLIDPLEAVKRSLTPGGLAVWEEAAGVDFAFRRLLVPRAEPA